MEKITKMMTNFSVLENTISIFIPAFLHIERALFCSLVAQNLQDIKTLLSLSIFSKVFHNKFPVNNTFKVSI